MKKLFVAIVSLTASVASAAGFALDIQSARATGQGSAMTAGVDDTSAIYYNPAGLVQTKGLNVNLGAHMIIPGVQFEPTGGEAVQVQANPVIPPHLSASVKLSDDVAVGLGAFVPFGNTATWPEGWVGEQLIHKSSVQFFYLSPSVSFRLHDRVRVGLGMDFVRGIVEQERVLNFVDSKGALKLGGSGNGSGAVAGLQVDIIKEMLSAGFVYRGSVRIPFEGSVDFQDVPTELQTTLEDQDLTSEFTLPDQYQLGLTFKPMTGLRVSADAWYVDWSAFKSISIQFDDPSLSTEDVKDWTGVWSFRFGGEYNVDNHIAVRAGFKIDPSPSPAETLAPNLPDSNRIAINLGGGYNTGMFSADLAYQLTILTGKESTFAPLPGRYSGLAHVIGLTLGYHLDAL